MTAIATLDRRAFVTGSAALLAGSAMAPLSWSADRPAAALLVVDRLFVPLLPRQRLAPSTVAIDGDVTALWRDTLQPLWLKRGAVIVGITREPALFCLEHMAQGMRHRLTHREPIVGTDAVRWTLAPVRNRGFA